MARGVDSAKYAKHATPVAIEVAAVLEVANRMAIAAGAPLDVIHLVAAAVTVDPGGTQAALGIGDAEVGVLEGFARQILPGPGPVVLCGCWPWTQRAITAWGAASLTGAGTIESLLHAIQRADPAMSRRPIRGAHDTR